MLECIRFGVVALLFLIGIFRGPLSGSLLFSRCLLCCGSCLISSLFLLGSVFYRFIGSSLLGSSIFRSIFCGLLCLFSFLDGLFDCFLNFFSLIGFA